MRKIILLSGQPLTGKSALARELRRRSGFHRIRTGRFLRDKAQSSGLTLSAVALADYGRSEDVSSEYQWIANEVEKAVSQPRGGEFGDYVVVDCVRCLDQVQPVRERFGIRVVHVHLVAPKSTLIERSDSGGTAQPLDESVEDGLRRDADLVIDTSNSQPGDVYVRVASRLQLFAAPSERLVDVIVGGQYGSEGKGQIAAYLSKNYDVLVRVGGPNAGHQVRSEHGRFTYHHLPSGCRDVKAEVLLGPGAVLRVPNLLKEIEDCFLSRGQLFIDPQAMTISDSDVDEETRGVKATIGSTASGTGAATARKILGRGKSDVGLANTVEELSSYIRSTSERLEQAYARGKRILLEGTQGSALSIHHGSYPHVTSRDTNVAGCLAEAGISPARVRRIIMVVRSYPIRVADPDGEGSTSGSLKGEIDFEEVARRSGLDPRELKSAEVTSTTGRKRRVAEFDWEQYRHACALNAPTDIVLTFADYLSKENVDARRFEQLTPETIQFIEELERVARAPVSMISTRFDMRAIIDRRNWW